MEGYDVDIVLIFIEHGRPRRQFKPTKDENRDQPEPLTLKFRCPAELYGKLPPPIAATSGLPGWLKAMPTQAFNAINMRDEDTIKRCPPFVDAMTCGFLIPLICDLRIENGAITWDNDIPPGGALDFPRSPIGFHDASQVIDTPLFEPDRFVIKFHNLWTHRSAGGLCAVVHPSDQSL